MMGWYKKCRCWWIFSRCNTCTIAVRVDPEAANVTVPVPQRLALVTEGFYGFGITVTTNGEEVAVPQGLVTVTVNVPRRMSWWIEWWLHCSRNMQSQQLQVLRYHPCTIVPDDLHSFATPVPAEFCRVSVTELAATLFHPFVSEIIVRVYFYNNPVVAIANIRRIYWSTFHPTSLNRCRHNCEIPEYLWVHPQLTPSGRVQESKTQFGSVTDTWPGLATGMRV